MTTEPNWQWYISADEERYQGPYDSREEAIDVAKADEVGLVDAEDSDTGKALLSFHIMEAHKQPIQIADHIDIDDMVTAWIDGPFEDLADPDEVDSIVAHVTEWQWADLQERLRAVTRAWQEEHKIVVQGFAFTGTRNSEDVTVELEAEDTP